MRIVGIVLIVITVLAVVYAIVMLSKKDNGSKTAEDKGRTAGDSEINSTSRLVNYAGAWGNTGCTVAGQSCGSGRKWATIWDNGVPACRCITDRGTVVL